MVLLFQDLSTVTICNIGANESSSRVFRSPETLFFSIYNAENDLLYVSESITYAACTNFGAISMPEFYGKLTTIGLKLWGLRRGSNETVLLYELYVLLNRLICQDTPTKMFEANQLARNSVAFGLRGNYFVVKEDLLDPSQGRSYAHFLRAKSDNHLTSYTFDDIRRLNRIIGGVNDFGSAKLNLSRQIDEIQEQTTLDSSSEQIRPLKFHIHHLHKFLAKQKMANDELLSILLSKGRQEKVLVARLNEEVPSFVEILTEKLDIVKSEIPPLYEALEVSIYPDLIDFLRLNFTVIREAFPIEPINSGYSYSIAGIDFPTSILEIISWCYDPEISAGAVSISSVDKINAGLFVIVHLMLQISSIMDIQLKYRIVQKNAMFYLTEICSLQRKSSKTDLRNSDDFELVVAKYPLYYNRADSEKVAKITSPVKSYELKNQKFERSLLLLKKNLMSLSTDVMDLYSRYLYGKMGGLKNTNRVPIDCMENFVWTLNYMLLFMTAPVHK